MRTIRFLTLAAGFIATAFIALSSTDTNHTVQQIVLAYLLADAALYEVR